MDEAVRCGQNADMLGNRARGHAKQHQRAGATPRDRDLIDRAAAALGKNGSEFMLEASRQAAEDALLDRTAFRLDADQIRALIAQLDAPPAPNERLRKLLATPAPWDK